MNERIIIGMVTPYLKEGALTYRNFELLFDDILSFQEQYNVLDILIKNNIDLVESHQNSKESTCINKKQIVEDEFELLYDNNLFSDSDYDEKPMLEVTANNNDSLIVRKKINLRNRTLIRMLQEGNAQAKQDLCVGNQGLVEKWVRIYLHYFHSKVDSEDLKQAGMLGMIKAAEKFDLNRGTEFSTYATWWIKQSIIREIMVNGYTIRIPVQTMERIQRVMRLDLKYAEETNFQRRVLHIAEDTGMSSTDVEEYISLFNQYVRMTSLDLPIGEKEEITLGELVQQEEEISVEDIVSSRLLREQLEEILETLTERERKVLKLRFGWKDGNEKTLEEIGKEFNVTRERIRQIEAKALRKLKHPSSVRKLEDYLD